MFLETMTWHTEVMKWGDAESWIKKTILKYLSLKSEFKILKYLTQNMASHIQKWVGFQWMVPEGRYTMAGAIADRQLEFHKWKTSLEFTVVQQWNRKSSEVVSLSNARADPERNIVKAVLCRLVTALTSFWLTWFSRQLRRELERQVYGWMVKWRQPQTGFGFVITLLPSLRQVIYKDSHTNLSHPECSVAMWLCQKEMKSCFSVLESEQRQPAQWLSLTQRMQCK